VVRVVEREGSTMNKSKIIAHIDDNAEDSGEYEVGYRKPPKRHRFKPGQSGNPRGRKSRVAYEEDDLPFRRYMMEQAVAKIGGKDRTVTKFEVVFFKLFQKAMEGDFKSIKFLIEQSGGFKEFRAEWKRQKSSADLQMIDEVLKAGEKWLNPVDAEKIRGSNNPDDHAASNKEAGRRTRH
jgi:hypothetical protein